MKLSRVLLTVVAVLALAAAVPATAQEDGLQPVFDAPVAATVVPDAADNSPEPVPNWGIDAWIGYYVGPCDAIDRQASGIGVNTTNCQYVEGAGDGNVYPGFPLHLPQGASVQYIRIFYYGNDVSVNIGAGFYKMSTDGTYTLIQALSPAATAGGATYEQFGPFSETIDNSPSSGYTYNILASLEKSGAATTRIYKFYLYYKLQISPDPAYATFSDVPVGAFGHRHVEALVASGITTGCGGGNFCPNQPLTRVQMAVFLAKALGLHWQY
jgi:hypothetical protein